MFWFLLERYTLAGGSLPDACSRGDSRRNAACQQRGTPAQEGARQLSRTCIVKKVSHRKPDGKLPAYHRMSSCCTPLTKKAAVEAISCLPLLRRGEDCRAAAASTEVRPISCPAGTRGTSKAAWLSAVMQPEQLWMDLLQQHDTSSVH